MRKEKYLVEIIETKKDTTENFLNLLNNKNEMFKLVNVDWLSIVDVKKIAGRTFVQIESDFEVQEIIGGKTDILFENELLKDPLELVYDVYDDFESFCADKITLNKLPKEALSEKRDWYDRDLNILYLVKAYLYQEKEELRSNHLTKLFYEFLERKKAVKNVRLLKYYADNKSFPYIDCIDKEVMPEHFEDFGYLNLDWKNIVLSLRLNVSIKNLKNNTIEFKVPRHGCNQNEEVE